MALAAKANHNTLAPMAAGNDDTTSADTNDMRTVQTAAPGLADRTAGRAAIAAEMTATTIVAMIVEEIATISTVAVATVTNSAFAELDRKSRGVEGDITAICGRGRNTAGGCAEQKRAGDESGFEHGREHRTNSFS